MRARILRTAVACVLLLGLTCGVAVAAVRPASARAGRRSAMRAPAATSTNALDRALNSDFTDAGGSSSGLVIDASTGQTLYARAATTPRLPASVEKLFTTSAALFDFGSAQRFSTRIYGVGSLRHGVFSGRLYLRGGGDPSFGDAGFDAANYGTGATMQALLQSLHAAGVRQVRGTILGDASIFDALGGGPDTGYHANLETEGELSGLAYDAGFTSGAETALQARPALWAAKALAAVAPAEGVRITRGTRFGVGRTPRAARLLASVSSPTVGQLIELTNAPSDNFFAETLDKDLGHFIGAGGTTSDGAAVVRATIASRLGLTERTIDGSGLSRTDRTTATTVVDLLEEMEPSVAFFDSLAVAGVSGTMQDEMLGTRAAGNCRGKTGTLHDVANLVGYCTAANGDRLVFAFLENDLVDSTYGHETEDLMGESLAAYSGNGRGVPAPTPPRPNAGALIGSGPVAGG